ncbi:MAG: hypothetical protein R3F07_04035 [Opitutaceae bacterium]
MKDCWQNSETETKGSQKAECPSCKAKGKSVTPRLLKHQLRPFFIESVSADKAYYFCPSPECEVAYFSAIGRRFETRELRQLITQKTSGPERPLCYCFGFTEGMLRDEIGANGNTTIPGRIKAEIKAGNCACEIRNPQGSCCLGNVAAAVRATSE